VDINCEAAEHGAGFGRQRSNRVEHEFMWDKLTLLDREEGVVQREGSRVAAGL